MAQTPAFPAANPGNPRTISPAKLAQLKKALDAFGDLGGIVLNRKTGHLVGGHQRVEAFRAAPNHEVTVVQVYQKPTKAGTKVEGYITVGDERFAYREVEWDQKTERAASLAANKGAGDWDFGKLAEWITDLNTDGFDLSLTMFDPGEIAPFFPEEPEPYGDDLKGGADPDGQDAEPVANQDGPPQPPPALGPPPSVPVKPVQLFYAQHRYDDFRKLTDALGEAYGHNNLSDTVFEALQRAAVSAAL